MFCLFVCYFSLSFINPNDLNLDGAGGGAGGGGGGGGGNGAD